MAKKIFDRIFKTFIIVIDVIWGLIISLFSIGILYQDSYCVERTVAPIVMGTVALIIANTINVIVRRLIKNY